MASVSHRKQERRRDRRRQVRVDAYLNDLQVKIVDVSTGGIGGFMAVLAARDLTDLVGKPTRLTLVPQNGAEQSFTVELTRMSEDAGVFGVRFLGLDDAQYSMVEKLVLGRLS